jgi:outer membrane protein TolC
MNKRVGRWLGTISMAAALVMAGCGVNQRKEVSIYRKLIDGDKPAPVVIAPGKLVTLTDALELANQNEEHLSQQGESYLQALIAKDRAFAAFLPTLSIGGSASHGGGPNVSNNTDLGSSMTGGINIFNGFRDLNTLKADDANIEQQKQLLFDLQQSVLLEVAQTYYTVLNAEQSVEVLSNSLEVQEARVNDIKSRADVGAAKKLDVAQDEAQASQTRVSLNQARADVVNGRSLLAFLVDEPIENNPLTDDFQPPEDIPDMRSMQIAAENGRQDLLAANAACIAARDNVEVAFGQYYPTASVNLNYLLYNNNVPVGNIWSSVLSINLPLFTGGTIDASVRQAWSSFRSTVLNQERLRRQIDNDVETAYTDLLLDRQQLKELQVQVEAAREALFLADQNYFFGNGTLLNRLIAQDTLLSSQLQLTTEQFSQKTAYFNLLRTAGRLTIPSVMSTTRPTTQRIRDLATMPAVNPGSQPTIQSSPTTNP